MEQVTDSNRAKVAQEGILDEILYNRDNYSLEDLEKLARIARTLDEIDDDEEEEIEEEPSLWQKTLDVADRIAENKIVQLVGKIIGGCIMIGIVNEFEKDDSYSGSNNGFIKNITSRFF